MGRGFESSCPCQNKKSIAVGSGLFCFDGLLMRIRRGAVVNDSLNGCQSRGWLRSVAKPKSKLGFAVSRRESNPPAPAKKKAIRFSRMAFFSEIRSLRNEWNTLTRVKLPAAVKYACGVWRNEFYFTFGASRIFHLKNQIFYSINKTKKGGVVMSDSKLREGFGMRLI